MNVEQPWHQNILTSRVKLIQTELIKVKSCQTCSFEYLERKRIVLQDLTASLYFRHLSSKMGVSAFHPMSHFPFARHPLKLGLSGAGAAAVSGAVCAASPSAMTLATRDKSSSRFQKSISACCFACNSYCKGDLLNPSILRCNSRDIYMSTILCTSDLCTKHSCIHCKDFWWQEICAESFLFLKLYLLLIRHGSAIMSGADSWRISLSISQQLLHLKEEWVVLTHWLDMFSRDFLPYTFVESRTSLSKSTMRWLNRSVELPPKL